MVAVANMLPCRLRFYNSCRAPVTFRTPIMKALRKASSPVLILFTSVHDFVLVYNTAMSETNVS